MFWLSQATGPLVLSRAWSMGGGRGWGAGAGPLPGMQTQVGSCRAGVKSQGHGCKGSTWHPQTLPSDSQQMGASREQTQQSGKQEPRDQADGKWGVGLGCHKGASQTRGGAGWASRSLGLPSTGQVLMPHREILEALGESRRFWGQTWAAGERGQRRGKSSGHTISV